MELYVLQTQIMHQIIRFISSLAELQNGHNACPSDIIVYKSPGYKDEGRLPVNGFCVVAQR